ncbi:MAG TPA: alpha/beta hydrolase [Caulobacteraceae bacterium]
MPIDRRAGRLLEMLAAAGDGAGSYQNADDRRRSLDDLIRLTQGDPPALVRVGEIAIQGPRGAIPLRLYEPFATGDRPGPALLFLHGGGWVAGGLESHDALCRRLALACACTLIAVGYRLAPEHPFPAALVDCQAALEWLGENAASLGIDPHRIGVAGDSAGGTLAAAVCLAARDAGRPPLALQLLLCPILDVAARSASRRRLARGHFLDEQTLERDLELYCPPGVARCDPRLSPLRAGDFRGLPPALVHLAEFDPFRDEGEAYARRLADAGVKVQLTCHRGMIHFFYALASAIPYALAAIDGVGREVRQAMSA